MTIRRWAVAILVSVVVFAAGTALVVHRLYSEMRLLRQAVQAVGPRAERAALERERQIEELRRDLDDRADVEKERWYQLMQRVQLEGAQTRATVGGK